MASTTTSEKLTCGIHHVGLAVKDLDKSFEFFKALGYDKIGGDPDYPSYFLSDAHTMITLWQTDVGATEFNRRGNVGLHHLAIKVPTEAALHKAYEAVTALDGVQSDFPPQESTSSRLPLMHAMVFEPSGNRIEFTFVRQVLYGS